MIGVHITACEYSGWFCCHHFKLEICGSYRFLRTWLGDNICYYLQTNLLLQKQQPVIAKCHYHRSHKETFRVGSGCCLMIKFSFWCDVILKPSQRGLNKEQYAIIYCYCLEKPWRHCLMICLSFSLGLVMNNWD